MINKPEPLFTAGPVWGGMESCATVGNVGNRRLRRLLIGAQLKKLPHIRGLE